MSFAFFSPLRTPKPAKKINPEKQKNGGHQNVKLSKTQDSNIDIVSDSCSEVESDFETNKDIFDIAKAITKRAQLEGEDSGSDFNANISPHLPIKSEKFDYNLNCNTNLDNQEITSQKSNSTVKCENSQAASNNDRSSSLNMSQKRPQHDMSDSSGEESIESHIEPSQWRPEMNSGKVQAEQKKMAEKIDAAEVEIAEESRSQLRYICPEDFEAMNMVNNRKSSLWLEDVSGPEQELFLVQIPADVDISLLEGKEIPMKGSQVLSQDTDENGITHVLEAHTMMDNSLEKSGLTLLLPKKGSKSKVLTPAPEFKGQVVISKSISVETKVNIEPKQPKPAKALPSGMKFRNVPFGAGEPVSVHVAQDAEETERVSGKEDTSPKKKDKKKKKKKRKSENLDLKADDLPIEEIQKKKKKHKKEKETLKS